jgi:hypothetical protein
MLQFFKTIVARLFRSRPLHGAPPFGPPPDPYARVREPRKPGPDGRTSAVAVIEPELRPLVRAVASANTPAGRAESHEG